jgi:opacity protein-like surface antigen
MERDIARTESDSVSDAANPSASFKHPNRNRKIDSLNSVTVKTERDRKSNRFDHTTTGIDFHGGLSAATLGGSAVQSEDALKTNLGFEVGAGYDYELSSFFSARPEVNLIQKGYAVKFAEGIEGCLSMYYIEVPLLLKASSDMGGFRPNLVAGPAVAVNVGNTAEIHTTDNSASISGSSSDTGFKKVDYGFQFGGGVEVAANSHNAITADFRYDLGLANINKSSGGDVKTRAMLFTMGFKF